MAEVVGQSGLMAPAGQDVRLPVAHMVCNQSPPIGDKPSLMTFRCRRAAGLRSAQGNAYLHSTLRRYVVLSAVLTSHQSCPQMSS